MNNVKNCDSDIHIPSSHVMCFLWGTDKPTELSWIFSKREDWPPMSMVVSLTTTPPPYIYFSLSLSLYPSKREDVVNVQSCDMCIKELGTEYEIRSILDINFWKRALLGKLSVHNFTT
jgi:hypothetical protein